MIVSGGVIVKSAPVVWSGTPSTWGSWPSSLQIGSRWVSYSAMYRCQHWVRTCVDKRAGLLAFLPLKVYRHDDLNRPEQPDDPYARLLARPNTRQSRNAFWRGVQTTYDIYGEAFIGKFRDSGGRPIELALMHPTSMHECGEDSDGVLWDFDNGRVQVKGIPDSDLIHLRTYNPDSHTRGLSKLESLRSTLENEDAALRAQSSFWRNGARPGVALTHPGSLSQPAADRLKLRWNEIAAGADNTGTTVVLEEGMKPEKLSLSAEEAQYIEARKLNREEVVAGYDMPPPAVHILDNATYCLPAEALVSTERGPLPISTIVAGDRVWSVVDGGVRSASVVWAGQTGFKALLTIKTQNRTLRCTANHPLWVRRTTRAPGAGQRGAVYRKELVWVEAAALMPGDIIVTLAELPEHGGDTCPTRTVSEGFAEFCGLLLGDGWLSPNGVTIARAMTALYMDHYRGVMRAEFRQRDGAITLGEEARSTRFASVSAARELAALGLSGNAHTKTVPGWVHCLSPKLRAAFVRGFLDADGSVDKKGRMSFASCNETMLRQIRDLCIGLGVPVTNMSSHRGTATLPNGRRCPTEMWAFTCSDPGANRMIGSHDPRYLERLAAGTPFGAGKMSTYYTYPVRKGHPSLSPPVGCGYAKVVSVVADETPVPVYDLEIEGSHNFVAEGVVVHNSNITAQLRSVYRDTMAPITASLESELETQLRASVRPGASGPDFSDDVYAEFLLDGVLRGDFEQRAEAYQKAINSGWTTPAEVRKLENLPFIEGSDRLYINSTMVPLKTGDAGEVDPKLVDAAGNLIRSGFDPAAVLAALGLPSMTHLGLLPVTLQKEEQFDADLEILEAELVEDPAAAVRMVMGRLSRQKTLDEVDLPSLVEGLNGLTVPVTRAVADARAAGDDIVGLRERIKALVPAGPRDELVEVLKTLIAATKEAPAPVINVTTPDVHVDARTTVEAPKAADVVVNNLPPPPLRHAVTRTVHRDEAGIVTHTTEETDA